MKTEKKKNPHSFICPFLKKIKTIASQAEKERILRKKMIWVTRRLTRRCVWPEKSKMAGEKKRESGLDDIIFQVFQV